MSGRFLSPVCLCAAILITFFGVAPVLQSCADGPEPFSDFSLHPDVPLRKYSAGRLGIVRPSFARSYLVVAYRYFSGVPLTKDEQFGADALWRERIGNDNIVDPSFDPEREKNPYIEKHTQHGRENWPEARKRVTTEPSPDIDDWKDGPNYSRYVNCSDDALENASITLNARVKTFGKEDIGVKEWVKAQDAVFLNCGSPKERAIPEPPSPSLPEILRFDREYQIAAAHMYANHFDEAEKSFERIAAEEKSPWRVRAPYLVARNLVRRASLDLPADAKPHDNRGFNADLLAQAETKIQSMLRDPRQQSIQPSLQALLDRVEFHLHPEAQTVAISQRLRAPAPDGKFYQWLCDYTLLLDPRPDARPGDFYQPVETNPQAYADATTERRKDDLTDWIVTYQANNELAIAHALEMWRAHTDSLPWLLSLLAKTESTSPFSAEVLAAADRIPATSPAYLTAFYHRMRLRNAAKQFAEVRKAIDALFKSSADIPHVSKDDLLDLRLDAASDLEDAVHFVARSGCPPEQEADPSSCTHVLGPHGADILDSLPLDSIVEAYRSPALPQDVKNQIARNIWMRAVILNRHDVAQPLDAAISTWGTAVQSIKPEYIADLIRQYESATTPEEKQFAAVFLLQHQFGYGYDMGTTQPWCASVIGTWRDTPAGGLPPQAPSSPAFLTAEQRKRALAERDTLDKADSQANYYVKVALDFAQKHPDDPRVPESLSRAVKNTDRNCNNARTGALSRKAFVLLHKNYANTSWAKNTKYWYD